jgi:CheY-like chemotaxis protein
VLRAGAEYDLMFTDIVMPGGYNGWSLADEVRRVCPRMKVLFTSGYEDTTRKGPLSPGVLLLHKPYKPQELAEKIRLVLAEPHQANG